MPVYPPGGLARNYSTQSNPIPPIPGPKQDELTQINAQPAYGHLKDVSGPPKLKY